MIEPHHREMALGMFRRGLTAAAIHDAMAGALRLDDVRLIIADASEADRRAGAIRRRAEAATIHARAERAHRKAAKDRLRARRDAEAVIARYRVLTIIPTPKKRKDR